MVKVEIPFAPYYTETRLSNNSKGGHIVISGVEINGVTQTILIPIYESGQVGTICNTVPGTLLEGRTLRTNI